MSIRLDPRRVNTLKQLAGDAGVRPGDLVRQWVEERIDAVRQGVPTPAAAGDLAASLAELVARVTALEAAIGGRREPPAVKATEDDAVPASETRADTGEIGEPAGEASSESGAPSAAEPAVTGEPPPRRPVKRIAASPSSERVALHDEMIAVLAERGPLSAGELAAAISERGRYTPPRSGKLLDAAMVSQRVSNPTYRARFVRDAGRIGLATQDTDAAE